MGFETTRYAKTRPGGGGEASGGENDGGGANLVPGKLLAVSLSWDLE